ncbi:MAG: PIN domain-containing protein [Nanoarchaeota archaeon]
MIILDTNFILTCVKQQIHLFEQFKDVFPGEKIIVPELVIEELNHLAKEPKLKMSERQAADLSLQIIGSENILILDMPEEKADDAIVNYAVKNPGTIVASLDGGIKKRIKRKAKFLTIRKKKLIRVA